ncbi:DinB family protein [Lentibacillus sediminis]|uniref:DinB family protein n=1 Tax=Lentibacillus sediminis TaxID=1940529 RepID=UPI000C1BABC3|nr:DinB family protein [Lentibacillus sediminis]
MTERIPFTRQTFLAFVRDLDEATADKEAAYFNNTIRWHVGHVLVTAESLLFGFPQHSDNLPEQYQAMFATGTKPADWTEEPPTLKKLAQELEEQQTRMEGLSADFFGQELPFSLPFGDFKTYGDILEMLLQHESEHLGKMKAMKQVVTKK